MSNKTFNECLDIVSKAHDWDNWIDVQLSAFNERTKHEIMMKSHDMFVNQIKNIMSYDDTDEIQKLEQIQELLKLE